MQVTPSEVTALMHTMQPAVPLMNILEGYKDLQTVMAVMETQQSFDLKNNLAQFKDKEGPPAFPEEHDRVQYVGYFLTALLDADRSLQLKFNFGSGLAFQPLFLMLKAFSVLGQRQFRLVQGLSLSQSGETNGIGFVAFEFEPLAQLFKEPTRITGFQVYLMRPSKEASPAQPLETVYTEPETEEGVVRVAPQLHVYKHIDTRV
jgi:hypothetical protein